MNTLVRPEMPAGDMSLTEWAAKYRRELSDWFRATHGHYASEVEWMKFVNDQLNYQIERDTTP